MSPSLPGTPVLLLLAQIVPSPLNPRTAVDDDLSAGLLARGQLSPILVRPAGANRYELVDGARRHAGAGKAGWVSIAAFVREMTDAEALDVMMETGGGPGARPLSVIDQARGYLTAMRVMGLATHEAVAAHFRVSRELVNQRLALLGLAPALQQLLVTGEISAKVAREIARIPDEAKRAEVAEWALKQRKPDNERVGYRAVQAHVYNEICRPLRGASFDRKDAQLVPDAGACDHCPFNTANDRETYGDIEKHTCMQPACFSAKEQASRARVIAREEKLGKQALPAEVCARAWRKGEDGLAWNAGFVELARQPSADLLKHEVAVALRPGSAEAEVVRVPTWRELCGLDDKGRAREGAAVVPQVWVGFDQQGRAVDVVKIEEALLAADENERAIFNAETIKRYHLDKGAETLKAERRRKPGTAAAPAAPTQAPELKSEVEDEETNTEELPEDDDEGEGEEAPTEEMKADLTRLATLDAWSERAVEWIVWALAAGAGMPVTRRDQGEGLLRDLGKPVPPAPVERAAEPVVDERKRLAEWVKARDLGMPIEEIARSYKVPVADVEGALAGRDEALAALRIKAVAGFTAAGIMTPKMIDRVVKTTCGVPSFGHLNTTEQFEKLLTMLAKKAAAASPTEGAEA